MAEPIDAIRAIHNASGLTWSISMLQRWTRHLTNWVHRILHTPSHLFYGKLNQTLYFLHVALT